MAILIMTEKPSVAGDIAKVVIGENPRKCQGYYEGNGYVVTWAIGHLIGLAEPEAYGYTSQEEMYHGKSGQAMQELPLIPEEFKLVVLEDTKEQFEVIKHLIHRKDITAIYNYGDSGEEGEILQAFIRWGAGCDKPVLRAMLTSMTEEAIRDSLNHLHPQEEFESRITAAYCKKKADWMLGMSLSRAETLRYNASISVGRVQSPTLYFVVSRFMEVSNFKVTDYYGLKTGLKEGFSVFWNTDVTGLFPQTAKDSMNRVLDKGLLDARAAKILAGQYGMVTGYEQKKAANDRPQLYDITELQRDANCRYGYSPDFTLACAQCLYESHKILSYPRTDSRYITSDLVPYMEKRVEMIRTIKGAPEALDLCAGALLNDGLNIDRKIVDDAKVTDHHALIPTEKIYGFDLETLGPVNEKEKKNRITKESLTNIMLLVLDRMIVAFSRACIYQQTKVTVTFLDEMTFTASGRTILQEGWKRTQEQLLGKEAGEDGKREDDEPDQMIPLLAVGQTVTVEACVVLPKKTTPPKLHTEATLLTAMENAGRGQKGAESIKGKGIGTQATRAEIIKSLFSKGYVEYLKKGKTNYVIPTTLGIRVIQVIPRELYSPMITAEWETKLQQIISGNMTEERFMQDFESFIREKTDQVRTSRELVSFAREKPVVATCPWCGSGMHRFQDKEKKSIRYYCSNKECACSLQSDDRIILQWMQKPLTERQMQSFLSNGAITLQVPSLYDKEKKFRHKFALEAKASGDRVYCNVVSQKSTAKKSKKKGVLFS